MVAVLTAFFLSLMAGPAAAQGADEEGVLVRVNGEAAVPADENLGVVVVVDGDLVMEGTATTVVVVNGRAELRGATVETLVVVNGTASLGAGSRVTGDVRLVESNMTRDPSVAIEGSIVSGTGDFTRGFWLLGVLFMIGWAVLTILAALALAAVAPTFARRAARTITADLGRTIFAGLFVWVVVPILGVVLFSTLIGIPTALTIWFAILPTMGLIGFVVAGIRLGEYLTGGHEGIGHPYLAALTGSAILLAVGAVPVLGPAVTLLATFLGSGAVALQALRAARSEPQVPRSSEPVPPATVGIS
jgi:hypothetical protein